MKLNIKTPDPLNILSSTKYVVENSQHVQINDKKIKSILSKVRKTIIKGLDSAEEGFGATGDFKKDAQLIFVEDAANFCFWAEKSKEKWNVEWPKGNIVTGGWYGLKACFEKALAENTPILDANYLANLTLKQARHLLRSSNGVEIPLIRERQKSLKEAGRVLLGKYDGQFIDLLEEAGFDAIEIVKLVYKNFSSFKDVATLDKKEIYFFKRAQIAANDVSYLSRNGKKVNIKRLNQLSAFADYKIPQILRAQAILNYSKSLSEKVDNYVLIPKNSREEIEIRSATVWSIELIRQYMPEYSAAQIDNAIWLISQDQSKVEKPYHRTYTVYY